MTRIRYSKNKPQDQPANSLQPWVPDCLPLALLSPDKEPVITMAEILENDGDDYARLYYMRSGRYLGVYATKEEADAADKYEYVRQLMGGRLPWEK